MGIGVNRILDKETGPQGFTLLEVLVSVVIVSLTITVFFQLMSAGMKLEYKAQKKIQNLIQAQQKFEQLFQEDMQSDDFKWQGQEANCTWSLKIKPVEMVKIESTENATIKLPSEIYRFDFRFQPREASPITLTRYVRYKVDFVSNEFKNDNF